MGLSPACGGGSPCQESTGECGCSHGPDSRPGSDKCGSRYLRAEPWAPRTSLLGQIVSPTVSGFGTPDTCFGHVDNDEPRSASRSLIGVNSEDRIPRTVLGGAQGTMPGWGLNGLGKTGPSSWGWWSFDLDRGLPTWSGDRFWEGSSLCDWSAGVPEGLPEASDVFWATQACFAWSRWAGELPGEPYSGWPATCCCAPPRNSTLDCDPPSAYKVGEALGSIQYHDNLYAYDSRAEEKGITLVSPTFQEMYTVGAGIAFLLENIDLAVWAACLVGSWSPEMKGHDLAGLVAFHLTQQGGVIPLSLTFSEPPASAGSNSGATAWAYTYRDGASASDGSVGFIVPISANYWTGSSGIVTRFVQGGSSALCAAAQAAGIHPG